MLRIAVLEPIYAPEMAKPPSDANAEVVHLSSTYRLEAHVEFHDTRCSSMVIAEKAQHKNAATMPARRSVSLVVFSICIIILIQRSKTKCELWRCRLRSVEVISLAAG